MRLVNEVVADAAADGAVWIEPAVNLSEHLGLGPYDEVLDVLVAAGREAESAHGVGVGWLVTADRTAAPSTAVEQASWAARYAGEGVASFGLANNEAAGGAGAVRSGLRHRPGGRDHQCPARRGARRPRVVRGAVDALGADRIQHGVRAVEDPDLLTRLADEGICLDVCPTSNVALSVVPGLHAHPLPQLLEARVPCSINADDPLLFGMGLLDEYVVCRQALGLDDAVLASCARASIEHSGAPADSKGRALQAIDAWLGS